MTTGGAPNGFFRSCSSQDPPPPHPNDPASRSLHSLASAAQLWSDRHSDLERLASVLSRSVADLARTAAELEREVRTGGKQLEALRSELKRFAKDADEEEARRKVEADDLRRVSDERSREVEAWRVRAERAEADLADVTGERDEALAEAERLREESRRVVSVVAAAEVRKGSVETGMKRGRDGALERQSENGFGGPQQPTEVVRDGASFPTPAMDPSTGVESHQIIEDANTRETPLAVAAVGSVARGVETQHPNAYFPAHSFSAAISATDGAALGANATASGVMAADGAPAQSTMERFLVAAGAAHHIEGSVADFASWLEESEDILNPSDLAEAVQDNEYLTEALIYGDGTGHFGVKPHETKQFRDGVLKCSEDGYDDTTVEGAATSRPMEPILPPAAGAGDGPGYGEAAPIGVADQPPASSGPQPWSCHACTYVNQGGTTCTVCGTARQSTFHFGAPSPDVTPFAPPSTTPQPSFSFGAQATPSGTDANAAFVFGSGGHENALPSGAGPGAASTAHISHYAPVPVATPPSSPSLPSSAEVQSASAVTTTLNEAAVAGKAKKKKKKKKKKGATSEEEKRRKEAEAEEEEERLRRAEAKEERARAIAAHEQRVKEEEEAKRAAAAAEARSVSKENDAAEEGKRVSGGGGRGGAGAGALQVASPSSSSRRKTANGIKVDALALVGGGCNDRPSPTRRAAKRERTTFTGDALRLSRKLYPPWKYDPEGTRATEVSRVFALVQNPNTAETGRQVARSEIDLSRLKGEADGLAKRRDAALTALERLREDLKDTKRDNKKMKEKIKGIENTAKSQLQSKESLYKKNMKDAENEKISQLSMAKKKDDRKWKECEEKRPQRQADAELKEERESLDEQVQQERRDINAKAREEKKKVEEDRNSNISKLKSMLSSKEDLDELVSEEERKAKAAKDEIEASRQNQIRTLEEREKKEKKELEETRQKRIVEIREGRSGFMSRFRFVDTETKAEKARIAEEYREEQQHIEVEFKQKVDKLTREYLKEKERIESELAVKKDKAFGTAIRDREELKSQIATSEEKVKSLDEQVDAKLEQVSEVRDAIKDLKKGGGNLNEDDLFHIRKRDECGHTLLMVAAQNNDIETARMCFELGADPNETSDEGLTAMFFADYFKLAQMKEFLAQHQCRLPKQDLWQGILRSKSQKMYRVDWDSQLKISEKAAVPADTLLASAEALEHDDEWKMKVLTQEEKKKDFTCFDSVLVKFDPSAKNIRRTVLLESDVCQMVTADAKMKGHFLRFVERLKPSHLRREKPVSCHRRAVVGMRKPFEVLCAPLTSDKVTKDSLVVLFSPFVGAESHGVSDVGVLVWAVSEDANASLIKTLVEKAEFQRNKVDNPDDRFPSHREFVLELGREMHLLDLRTTSVLTSCPMELFIFNIDENELRRLGSKDFAPKKRMVHSEQQMRDALFRTSESESEVNQGILSDARVDMSTHLAGGAGTGKTALLIKKLISEGSEKRMLVVSRLPRLVSSMKAAVEAELDEHNITFATYEELMTDLARRMDPTDEEERHSFLAFAQVRFGVVHQGTLSSASFVTDFIEGFLGERERKTMKSKLIEPITLWTAIRNIKANINCVKTKSHLTQEEYVRLPKSFGLNQDQRKAVFCLYLRYEEWRSSENFWDESDRVLYVLKYGGSVFSDANFIPWQKRAYQLGETELLESPMFYDEVYVDECQDLTEADLALFVRMSASERSVFFGGDPAQSVEIGIRMRAGTVNDVFNACIGKNAQVKSVLQNIQMRTNHRTHAQNLALAKAVRKVLTRSFGVPGNSDENALMNGPMPEALLVPKMKELGTGKITGGNIVFITPEAYLSKLRSDFLTMGVKNDCFGVVEAKGLEFVSVALVGFFSHFERLGNEEQWKNVIRWLHSKFSVTKTESGEKVEGKTLEDCDYVLSHPEVEDQAMMLYTALTRSRERLYFVEVEEEKKKRKGGKGGLAQFVFHHLKKLGLVKIVDCIDEGEVEMTAQQHKARGVLLVTQAIELSRNFGSNESVKDKFMEAASRFQPDKGNDKHLLDQTMKHLEAILLKRSLVDTIKKKFFDRKRGEYVLDGCFSDIVKFEDDLAKFFKMCMHDPFLVDELHEVRTLVEDVVYGTIYEIHFADICEKMKSFEG